MDQIVAATAPAVEAIPRTALGPAVTVLGRTFVHHPEHAVVARLHLAGALHRGEPVPT